MVVFIYGTQLPARPGFSVRARTRCRQLRFRQTACCLRPRAKAMARREAEFEFGISNRARHWIWVKAESDLRRLSFHPAGEDWRLEAQNPTVSSAFGTYSQAS